MLYMFPDDTDHVGRHRHANDGKKEWFSKE